MTREEMVRRLENLGVHVADVAAAELRKSCATCEHWQFPNDWEPQECIYAGRRMMPTDGSGYCRPGYEPKETR
jgi:hypothetical protein